MFGPLIEKLTCSNAPALLSHLFRVPVALARKRFDRLRSRLFAAG